MTFANITSWINPVAFGLLNLLATAIGAAICWAKLGKVQLKAYIFFGPLVNLLPIDRKKREACEYLLFILVGCFVANFVTQPENVRQAFAAGLGWTSPLPHNG